MGSWTKLAELRADTPAHVVERLGIEYRERVETVSAAIAKVVSRERPGLAAEHDKRVAERSQLQEEFLEQQIRHRVGEHDNVKWKKIQSDLDRKLASVSEKIEHATAGLARLDAALEPSAQAAPLSAADAPTMVVPPEPLPVAAAPVEAVDADLADLDDDADEIEDPGDEDNLFEAFDPIENPDS